MGCGCGRLVASLDRKRLGQDRWEGRKTGSEAFSIRRLGGRRWRLRRTRGTRQTMEFECLFLRSFFVVCQ